jgi:Na+/H+-translocating membrane pyrophosphatase
MNSNSFDDMLKGWKDQPVPSPQKSAEEIARSAKQCINKTRNRHYANILVLSITLAILIAYFIFSGFGSTLFVLGMCAMMGALAIRIAIEAWSIGRLQKLNILESTQTYAIKLLSFVEIRKAIHGPATYLTYGLYAAGFSLLLPAFRGAFSSGFFLYIVISGAVTLLALFIYIKRKVNQELNELSKQVDELSSFNSSLNQPE